MLPGCRSDGSVPGRAPGARPAVSRPAVWSRTVWSLAVLLVALAAACAADDSGKPATTTTAGGPATTAPPPELPALSGSTDPDDQTPPVGTNGIALADDDTLWIADGQGDQVLHVDIVTGDILARWPTPGGAFPDDVALDDRGRVFWTGFQSGQIGRIDPAAGDHRQIAELPAGANPLAFTLDGRLLVGLALIADGLYELDPDGGEDPRLLNDELGNVNGFDVAGDGQLYGPRADGELVRIDFEAGVVTAVVADGLGFGSAVAVGPDGELWHLSALPEPRLRRIDRTTGAIGEELELDTDAVDNLAVADDGSIYVTTFNRPVVLVIEAGDATRELATRELTVGRPG
jgi:streptogramin lyase